MSGELILVPTPIDEVSPLEPVAKERILNSLSNNRTLYLVEEHKAGRRRWLHFGLPRETIADFILYNEHTREELAPQIIGKLKEGYDVFLMSDGGLPAFCDPGSELVFLAHQNGIKVTSTPFPNSIALAFALSGIKRDEFHFAGFLPHKGDERRKKLDRLLTSQIPVILMDTPYRLKSILEELAVALHQHQLKRKVFLAMDLCSESEELIWGFPAELVTKFGDQKREFILIVNN